MLRAFSVGYFACAQYDVLFYSALTQLQLKSIFVCAEYNAWNNRYFSTPDIRNFLDKSYPKLRSRGLLIFDDIPSG